MDWFLYDNGLRHERVKSYVVEIPILVNLVIITLSNDRLYCMPLNNFIVPVCL